MKKETNEAISLIEKAAKLINQNLHPTEAREMESKLSWVVGRLRKNQRRLSLLNYEGDVLALVRYGDSFQVVDQWGETVAQLERHEVLAFLSGESKIRDSKGTFYSYPDHHLNAKPTASALDKFLYGE